MKNPEPPAPELPQESRRDRRRRLKEEADAAEQRKATHEEDDDEDDDDDEEEPEKEEKPKQPEAKKHEASAPKPVKKEEVQPVEEEEDDDEDDEDEDVPQPTRQPKKHHMKKWQKSIQAQRMEEDRKNPRKGLLKHKKPEKSGMDNAHNDPDDDEDDEEDDGADDDNDEGQFTQQSAPKIVISDVVTVRKKTGHYNRKAITNRDDRRHATKLDVADYLVEKHDFDAALTTYDQVIKSYRESPRAHFGRARVYQLKSEFQESDSTLDEAIAEYQASANTRSTGQRRYA
ncbi:Aspartyl/Asparaginyl beta-hydroxylase family protein [Aphelenchoides avenae]|nr:Aspartyl/Asparaginyl beta-hydroxylase family protein [Aphelenchus avenae]